VLFNQITAFVETARRQSVSRAAEALFISQPALTARLKGLEAYELVERKVFAETPVRVEYHLTDRGRALGPVFAALGEWANKYGCGETAETDPNAA